MINLLRNRRSIRKYKNIPIENHKIDRIIKIGLTSPSGRDLKPYHFTVIQDKDIILKLSKARGPYTKMLEEAGLVIAIFMNPNESPSYLADASILATYLQLAIQAEGLGSCWVHTHRRISDDGSSVEDNVKSILNEDKDSQVLCLLSIGYPNEDKPSHKKEDLLYRKVHYNSYGV